MTSSVRLPSVALSRPPIASPVFSATDSVAKLSNAASGTIASTDSTNSVVWDSGMTCSPASTAGTKTSSHSIGLRRISASSAPMESASQCDRDEDESDADGRQTRADLPRIGSDNTTPPGPEKEEHG